MQSKAFVRAHAIADKFRTIRSWKPGTLLARRMDAKGGGTGVADLYVYDIIGKDWWTGEGITAKSVQEALDSAKGVKQLNVFINSEGGDVFEAKAIYTQLQRFDAQKTVYIDGIAASAATFVAMAGDKIVTADVATWMIHEAWGGAMGEAADLRAYADLLDMMNGDIASIYAKRTGKSVEEMRAAMAKETWMNASQALEMGLTDEVATEEPDEDDDAKNKAALQLPMAQALNATREKLAITAADRMAFVAASRNAVQVQKSSTRASPAKGAAPASR